MQYNWLEIINAILAAGGLVVLTRLSFFVGGVVKDHTNTVKRVDGLEETQNDHGTRLGRVEGTVSVLRGTK